MPTPTGETTEEKVARLRRLRRLRDLDVVTPPGDAEASDDDGGNDR